MFQSKECKLSQEKTEAREQYRKVPGKSKNTTHRDEKSSAAGAARRVTLALPQKKLQVHEIKERACSSSDATARRREGGTVASRSVAQAQAVSSTTRESGPRPRKTPLIYAARSRRVILVFFLWD